MGCFIYVSVSSVAPCSSRWRWWSRRPRRLLYRRRRRQLCHQLRRPQQPQQPPHPQRRRPLSQRGRQMEGNPRVQSISKHIIWDFLIFRATILSGNNLLLTWFRLFWQLVGRYCSYLLPRQYAEVPKSKSTVGCYHAEWSPCKIIYVMIRSASVDVTWFQCSKKVAYFKLPQYEQPLAIPGQLLISWWLLDHD